MTHRAADRRGRSTGCTASCGCGATAAGRCSIWTRPCTRWASRTLDAAGLGRLADLDRVLALTGAPLLDVLTWWAPIDTFADRPEKEEPVKSLYDRVYLQPGRRRGGRGAGLPAGAQPRPDRAAPNTVPWDDVRSLLQAALTIDADELALLLDETVDGLPNEQRVVTGTTADAGRAVGALPARHPRPPARADGGRAARPAAPGRSRPVRPGGHRRAGRASSRPPTSIRAVRLLPARAAVSAGARRAGGDERRRHRRGHRPDPGRDPRRRWPGSRPTTR